MQPDATTDGFSEEQKLFLEGMARGLAAARTAAPAVATPTGPDAILRSAQERVVAQGGNLTQEEEAKRDKHPFDIWDEMVERAAREEFPKGLEIFRYKFHGLFYVAPAQDSFMCRLRNPNGIIDAHKLARVADLAERYGGGYAHVTTRANLQIREIPARHAIDVLQGLIDAGLTSRGAGADNVRNITGNPTAGIDSVELYDTRPLGLALHHAILNHRELYGLPRKCNIAFDGGGSVASLDETNDIGFAAARVGEGKAVASGVYFRVGVGGITGHGDFASDLGVVVEPSQCVPVARAILRVFIDEGDRTNRTRARLKYALDRMGLEAFLAAVESHLPAPLPRLASHDCEPRPRLKREGHVGFHPQRQNSEVYCGVVLPVGRMTAQQMRGLADIAQRYGSGTLRLTVWQNLIISDIAQSNQTAVEHALAAIGLGAHASPARAGIVACTGNTGCKFSASDTKRHALAIVEHLEHCVALDTPLNIHVTGCPHSCAQHAIADVGLLATKVALDDEREVEGYHLYAGGAVGAERKLGREIARDIPADRIPLVIERLVAAYLRRRASTQESFMAFAKRHTAQELVEFATSDPRETLGARVTGT
jgi:ferredoxin-nitrite reductase